MWSSLDVLLGLAFMAIWAVAVAVGYGIVIAFYCLLVARRAAPRP